MPLGREHACEIASCHRCWRSGDEITTSPPPPPKYNVVMTTHSFNCIRLSALLI